MVKNQLVTSFALMVMFSFGAVVPSSAANKYVNCAVGDDTRDGSIANPWKTIAHAAATAGGGDVVHVTSGPCPINNVAFSSRLSGPGPNCRSNETACTIFRGEPGAVSVTKGSGAGTQGFVISGVAHLKIENFTFAISGGSQAFDEPVKISGGQPSDIFLNNVSVEGAHASGLHIWYCHDVLVQGGHVQDTTGDGYQIRGSIAEPTSNVVFREAVATHNGKDGFVVPSDTNEVSNIVFDRTVSTQNGAIVSNGDGYDIQGSLAVPSPTPVARFLDAEGSFNAETGFKVWSPAQFENVYAFHNTAAGIKANLRSGLVRSFVTVLNSTITDNGSPQLNVGLPGIDLSLHNSLVSGSGTVILEYDKRYTGTEVGGGTIDWTRDLASRTGSNGDVVKFVDRAGIPHVCTSPSTLATCDATGDCNFDFRVTVDEIIKMTDIVNGYLPLSACYQGDYEGDGRITVADITRAVNISLDEDAHDATVTNSPSFQVDLRHLLSNSPGWNAGLAPSSFFAVSVCRAGTCDADSHARPDAGGYDIGAYEGTGQQAKSPACLGVAPGQCITGGAFPSRGPDTDIEIEPAVAYAGQLAEVPIRISTAGMDIEGVQFDLIYDTAAFDVPDPERACALNSAAYGGQAYTGTPASPPSRPGRGRLRVVIFDIGGGILPDGMVVICRLAVLPNAVGSYPLAIDGALVANTSSREIIPTVHDAPIEIPAIYTLPLSQE